MLTRRAFPKILLAGVAATTANSQQRRSGGSPSTTGFIFAGINDNQNGRTAIGALVCTQFARHQHAIEEIRRQHHYYSVLRYRSTDKFRMAFANAMIDYFVSQDDLTFTGYLFSGYERPDFDEPIPLEQRTLHQQVALVINRAASRQRGNINDTQILHFRGLGGNKNDDLELIRYVRRHLPHVAYFSASWERQLGQQKRRTGPPRPAPNNLAQLGGFLSGNAAAFSHPPDDTSKRALLQRLAHKLGVNNPSTSSFQNNDKFQITPRTYR